MLVFHFNEALPQVAFDFTFGSSEFFFISSVPFGVALERLARFGVDIAYILIYFLIRGKTAAFKLAVNKVGNKGVHKNKYRNAKEHSTKAKESGTNNDGEHYPESVYTNNISKDLGSEEVAVELLENNDEDKENEGLNG